MEQNQTPLLEAVTDFIATKPAYFRIPGTGSGGESVRAGRTVLEQNCLPMM